MVKPGFFGEWFARSPYASALKSFIAIVVALAVAEWSKSGTIDFSSWQTWVIAALASAVVPALNASNPSDDRYGAYSYGGGDAGQDGDL